MILEKFLVRDGMETATAVRQNMRNGLNAFNVIAQAEGTA